MKLIETTLQGVFLLEPVVFKDSRGFFFESYHAGMFSEAGIRTEWLQDNHAGSVRDTIRGLHFQRGAGQAKLVRCIRGEIWDVVVDLRPESSRFGTWHAETLSEENHRMLYIPEGFAHGYAVISDWSEVVYKCGTEYDPDTEDGIMWNDPDIAVAWPLLTPLLSKRDRTNQSFQEYCRKMGILK